MGHVQGAQRLWGHTCSTALKGSICCGMLVDVAIPATEPCIMPDVGRGMNRSGLSAPSRSAAPTASASACSGMAEPDPAALCTLLRSCTPASALDKSS